jgi:hypothetical protein
MKRTCPKCNWVFPSTFNKKSCTFCRTELTHHQCKACEEFLPTDKYIRYKSGKNKGYLTNVCIPCSMARDTKEKKQIRVQRFYGKRREAAELLYNQWVAKADLPFKLMTEDDWLETCRYFGGCALCGNEHIESRNFFVPFEHGGRYVTYNMFPTCGTCATHTRFVENPFIWLDHHLGTARKLGVTDEKRHKMMEWFIEQVEKVSGTSG